MKIAILHFHLNRGGVTQVISSHLRAMAIFSSVSEILILHGGRCENWKTPELNRVLPVHVKSIPSLAYDEDVVQPRDLKRQSHSLQLDLINALRAVDFHSDETILHVHNHSLGKNVALPGALAELAEKGYRQLLHIHDFVEDLRPDNYLRLNVSLQNRYESVGEYLYPNGDQIHYAVLNNRDKNILQHTGIAKDRIHFLPNPVVQPPDLPEHVDAFSRFRRIHQLGSKEKLVLYPVRGIRRKNLGEFLLWSALAPSNYIFAITLPATSGPEIPSFADWKMVAKQLKLPVLFDVGLCEELTFADNLAAADRVITTSVAEGFGMTFLECWLANRLLIGRNLPEITCDFKDRNINLEHLRDSIFIPIEYIGSDNYLSTLLQIQHELSNAYGHKRSEESEETLKSLIGNDRVDFATLTPEMQKTVLQRLHDDPAARPTLLSMNPWISRSLEESSHWDSLVDKNRQSVEQHFCLASIGKMLDHVYASVLESPITPSVGHAPSPQNVLNYFISVKRLHSIRIKN